MSIKLVLGDLRHNSVGKHSVCMPLNLGVLASYLTKIVGEDEVEIKFYVDPDNLIAEIDNWQPDIVALSSYMWNTSLTNLVFKYVKKHLDNVMCVSGGPNFPSDVEQRDTYLRQFRDIDFYVFLEAEISFANLIQEYINNPDIEELKKKTYNGVAYLNKDDTLIVGEINERIFNLDDIPSPYSTEIMSKWFEHGNYAPFIETARGCPFTCAFCHAGNDYYKKITRFSKERLNEDLDYISGKMENYPHSILYMADNNFGMYEQDIELAHHLREMQDECGWPIAFDVSTGKLNYDRILHVASILQNKMGVTCSCQTLNTKTLDAIGRKNLPMEEYKKVQNEIKSRGMSSVVELIVPLPEETKESFFDGIKQLIDADVGSILVHTTILLENTRLNSKETRDKYDMKTKFRLVPRQFGEYDSEKCFEIEEVCIETNTLSFDEYLEIRGFFLIIYLLSSKQFDIIRMHLGELGISLFDYSKHIWLRLNSDDTELSKVYRRYIDETEAELWDSPSDLREYFLRDENYEKLLSGDSGDNLIRKYTTEIIIKHHIEAVQLLYDVLLKIANINVDIITSLYDAKSWLLHVGNIMFALDDSIKNKTEWMLLSHDVPKWYHDTHMSQSLSEYKGEFEYTLTYDTKNIDKMLKEGKNLFGDDVYYNIGKILININPQDFWRKSTKVE